MKHLLVVLEIALTLTMAACLGPARVENSEEIAPNESAFLVPLEGETKTGQSAFESVTYLTDKKIAAKRVVHQQRKKDTGRWWFSYEWIPATRLIKVDRRPVTREWIGKSGLVVETIDSISFSVGVNITTAVYEEDAAEFLYHYAGKPLATVVDENVRGLILTIFAREFGKHTLIEARSQKNVITTVAFEEAKTVFGKMGITINYMGISEGLTYQNAAIQKAIDDAFIAENQKKISTQQAEVQAIDNEKKVQMAIAERRAAEEFARAQDAQISKIKLEIARIQAETSLEAAKKWNGQLPSQILPSGSSLLFGLDTKSSTN